MHIKGNSLLHDKCTESNFYFKLKISIYSPYLFSNETIIIDHE